MNTSNTYTETYNPESLTAPEREIVITTTDNDDYWFISTGNRPFIRRILKDDRFTVLSANFQPDSDEPNYLQATIASKDFTAWSGLKRRVSEEQRAVMAERAKERFGK